MDNWTNCNYSLNKIDVKKTLQELHQKFPNLTIEDLFDILDCIKYEYALSRIQDTEHMQQMQNQI